MTDIEQALTEALEAAPDWLRRQLWSRTADHLDAASILCESEPMQTIARQAAIGAAVEGLPDYVRLDHVGDHWRVMVYSTEERINRTLALDMSWHIAMSRPTLYAAIEAALGDDDA